MTFSKFKMLDLGTLVRIAPGTHAPDIPSHRTGIIVEIMKERQGNTFMVMLNGKFLKFHPMWLEVIQYENRR